MANKTMTNNKGQLLNVVNRRTMFYALHFYGVIYIYLQSKQRTITAQFGKCLNGNDLLHK